MSTLNQGTNGIVNLEDGWVVKHPATTTKLNNELGIYTHLVSKGCKVIAEIDLTRTDVVRVKHLEGYVSFKELSAEQRALLQPYAFMALQKLHEAGVLHTDAHLGNILVRLEDNDVKIIDFGEAEICDDRREFIWEMNSLGDCFRWFSE